MSDLPVGWERVQLKEIVNGKIKNGFSPNTADSETGFWVLGLGALSETGLNISEIKSVVPTEKVLGSQLEYGDFLISRSNTPDKVGRSALYRGEIDNCSYPDLMMKFRVKELKIFPYFLENVLKSKSIRNYFRKNAAGSSKTMVKINKSIVEKTPIILPSIEEQRKIAQILSTWDNAIATTEKQIANSKQQKKALMQQLLTGKKRLAGFSGDWESVQLNELIQECKKEKENCPEKIELLTVKLHNQGVVKTDKYPKPTKNGRPYYKRFQGELIIGRQNLHNGGVAIVPRECNGLIASNAISSFTTLDMADIQFILAIMGTAYFKYVIDNLTGGTGQKEVSTKNLLKVQITVPKLKEQQKIAQVLTTADNEISTLETQLTHLQQEKKALMQQLLTGKRRVQVES